LGRQHAPVGHVLPAAQVVPPPSQVPPAVVQSADERERQEPPVKQHAPLGCGHGEAHVEPSPRYVPPWLEQFAGVCAVTHCPEGRQHAPTPGVQFSTLDHVVRDTQSPEGRQKEKRLAKVDQPPLEGHPRMPQFTPNNQFAVAVAKPETSVVGKAFEFVGGAVVQGFCVWLWC
jgi:hypothetical protein